MRFLIEDNPSPTMRMLREHVKEKFPKAVWHVYEPIDDANNGNLTGTKIALGAPHWMIPARPVTIYRKINRIVSLDCDFLGAEANSITEVVRFRCGADCSNATLSHRQTT